jgi:pimeloyl-ACP methyl ester carboxylesterase
MQQAPRPSACVHHAGSKLLATKRSSYSYRVRCSAVTSAEVQVRDATLELLSTAQATAHPPVLFLHGAAHGAWCWAEHFMPFLEQRGVECHALSFRGHVRTSVHYACAAVRNRSACAAPLAVLL